jgi:hypothetical protein
MIEGGRGFQSHVCEHLTDIVWTKLDAFCDLIKALFEISPLFPLQFLSDWFLQLLFLWKAYGSTDQQFLYSLRICTQYPETGGQMMMIVIRVPGLTEPQDTFYGVLYNLFTDYQYFGQLVRGFGSGVYHKGTPVFDSDVPMPATLRIPVVNNTPFYVWCMQRLGYPVPIIHADPFVDDEGYESSGSEHTIEQNGVPLLFDDNEFMMDAESLTNSPHCKFDQK